MDNEKKDPSLRINSQKNAKNTQKPPLKKPKIPKNPKDISKKRQSKKKAEPKARKMPAIVSHQRELEKAKNRNQSGGQSVSLTKEMITKLSSMLRMGMYMEGAAAVLGIAKTTLYDWLRRGARGDPTHGGLYIELSNTINKSIAESELRDLNVIDRAAQGTERQQLVTSTFLDAKGKEVTETRKTVETKFHWQAAAWKLERKHPKRWGKVDQLEVSGRDGGPIEVEDKSQKVMDVMKDPETIKLVAQLADKMFEAEQVIDLDSEGNMQKEIESVEDNGGD